MRTICRVNNRPIEIKENPNESARYSSRVLRAVGHRAHGSLTILLGGCVRTPKVFDLGFWSEIHFDTFDFGQLA